MVQEAAPPLMIAIDLGTTESGVVWLHEDVLVC